MAVEQRPNLNVRAAFLRDDRLAHWEEQHHCKSGPNTMYCFIFHSFACLLSAHAESRPGILPRDKSLAGRLH